MVILFQEVWNTVSNYFYGEHFLCHNFGPSFCWLLAGCRVPYPRFFIGTIFSVFSEGIFVTIFEVASLESDGFMLASLRNTCSWKTFQGNPFLQLPLLTREDSPYLLIVH